MALGGSGKGIQIVVGTDYNDKDLKRAQRDLDQLKAKAGRATGPMQRLGATMKDAFSATGIAAGLSVAAVTHFAMESLKAFSQVEDSQSALTSSFGDTGRALVDWANKSAGAFNLSQREALSAAQTMAVMGDSAGLAGQDLERFARTLSERAADAASYFGGTTEQAITAFGAALRGESEPIRRYGVMLDDATLKARAFSMGLTSSVKQALTPQQKSLAAYNEILAQTTRVQGDVARTSDSMANRMKKAQADIDNLQVGVGEYLAQQVAAFSATIEILQQYTQQNNDTADSTKKLAEDTSFLGEAMGAALNPVAKLAPFLTKLGQISEAVRRANMSEAEQLAETRQQHLNYADAVVRSHEAAKDAVTQISRMGEVVTMSGQDAEDAATKFDIFATAIAKTDQVVAFRQAIDEVGKAFKRTNTPVNIFGEKGTKNFELLKGLIQETASFAEMQTSLAGKASVASQGLDTLATSLANSKMDPQTKTLLLEPFQALIDDLREAGVDVTNLQTKLDALKSKTITVTTNYQVTGDAKKALYNATGGLVNGAQYLSGGGSRGSDTIPTWLTPGEFVVKAPMVKKWGADLFSQLNAGINPLDGMGTSSARRQGGLVINGGVNVMSAPGEAAEQSLPRALRRIAFLAGV